MESQFLIVTEAEGKTEREIASLITERVNHYRDISTSGIERECIEFLREKAEFL